MIFIIYALMYTNTLDQCHEHLRESKSLRVKCWRTFIFFYKEKESIFDSKKELSESSSTQCKKHAIIWSLL